MIYLLNHLLSQSAVNYPNSVAVEYQDKKITYAELEVESNKLSCFLSECGITRGSRVGIHLNRSIEAIIAAFGVLKTGAAYVPLDPLSPVSRMGHIIRTCGVGLVLTASEKLAKLEQTLSENPLLKTVVVMNKAGSGGTHPVPAKVYSWPDVRETVKADVICANTIETDLAYILFTSGSTGIPKGVMLSHLNALTFINSACHFFQIQPDDRFSNICPLHFDMSVFDLFVAFKAGATVVIIPEVITSFPVKLAEVIAEKKISVWNSVPSALSLLATYKSLDSHDLSSLRLILFAGETFPLKYLRRLQEAVPKARYCNMYGQTEANSSTYFWVEGPLSEARTSLPIGRSLPNFDVFALDDDGKQVSTSGEVGELYIRSSTVALGYWGDVEKSEAVFVRNPLGINANERVYKTGDLVHLDSDGNYVFVGRKDHMIKSRGYRVEIGEIETILCNHPEIKSAVAFPIPDEIIGNRIGTVVVPFNPGQMSKMDIVKYCSERLPRYMVPDVVCFRDSLPTTSSGKVDRKILSRIHQEDSVSVVNNCGN